MLKIYFLSCLIHSDDRELNKPWKDISSSTRYDVSNMLNDISDLLGMSCQNYRLFMMVYITKFDQVIIKEPTHPG